jgi:uncharacterized protein DUF1592/uncharacterized protein DUF1588/uncharacterized protein DUF1587/uncharacterized protein DUF1585/uncharacterized protein DUF1595
MLPLVRNLFASLLVCAPVAGAAPNVAAFVREYCTDCHDAETKKGGLDLTSLAWDLDQKGNFDEWVKVFDLVGEGHMPPKKKERPNPKAARDFLANIGNELRAFDARREAEIGRTVLRRLNRVEYERTIQDLLGIATPLAALLPADTPTHGFDTVAEGLRLSTLQIEKYLEAADVALDAAINLGPEPERITKRYFFKDEKGVRANLDKPETAEADDKSGRRHRHLLRELPDAIVYFNEGYPAADVRQFSAKAAGTYRIRISAYGFQSKGQPIPMRVYTDNYREKQLLGWFEMPPDQARVVEFTATLPARVNLRIEPSETGVDEKGQNVYNTPVSAFTGAGLALQWVEVEGPLLESWPPASMKKLFGDTPLTKIDETKKNRDKRTAYEFALNDPKASAKAAIERFATRAFRRPLEPGEADRFVKLVTNELDAGRPFIDSMRVGFRGVLTAPQFLLFEERPGKLNDYALASRLSYFLWSTMPDDELLAAAARKNLAQPKVLRAQVERMLKDQRFGAFVQNFTGQWLDLRNIDATTPDMRLYPEFDERLRVSIVQETEAFFTELVSGNLSANNLVQSDFAMLNSRLAAHYSIDGVDGEQIRKVPLPPDSVRGGLLTQASVLKVSANGTTTSPVLRGVWVMKRLLGQPPTPPPPGTGTIEPDTRGATTVREQLAKHRTMETCAGCHNKIDPPGFALECFDVIGGFRERYRSQGNGDTVTVPNTRSKRKYIKLGLPVDASGELPDGQQFSGIQDFKKILLKKPDQILTALTKNLVIYSTGAAIGFADRSALETIAEKTKQQGGGVRTLIQEVVASPIFQTK